MTLFKDFFRVDGTRYRAQAQFIRKYVENGNYSQIQSKSKEVSSLAKSGLTRRFFAHSKSSGIGQQTFRPDSNSDRRGRAASKRRKRAEGGALRIALTGHFLPHRRCKGDRRLRVYLSADFGVYLSAVQGDPLADGACFVCLVGVRRGRVGKVSSQSHCRPQVRRLDGGSARFNRRTRKRKYFRRQKRHARLRPARRHQKQTSSSTGSS